MSAHDLDLIPSGTVFEPSEIIHYADPDMRDLAQAIVEADVLVTVPHAGSAIPEELAAFLSPALSPRLQAAFSDAAAAAVVKRWAEIDPRIIALVNPHPRLVRDLRQEAPSDRPVDSLLDAPFSPRRADELAETLATIASQGFDVYEAMREELTELFITKGLTHGGAFTRFSVHDSMRTAVRSDGSLQAERSDQSDVPQVVTLSNGGDDEGEERDPAEPLTMLPADLRMLAEAHRAEFEVAEPEAVTLNQASRGIREISDAAARFRGIAAEASAAELTLSAVQAEFSREYLLGSRAVEELHEPGRARVEADPAHIDFLAYACKRAWDAFRDRADA